MAQPIILALGRLKQDHEPTQKDPISKHTGRDRERPETEYVCGGGGVKVCEQREPVLHLSSQREATSQPA